MIGRIGEKHVFIDEAVDAVAVARQLLGRAGVADVFDEVVVVFEDGDDVVVAGDVPDDTAVWGLVGVDGSVAAQFSKGGEGVGFEGLAKEVVFF